MDPRLVALMATQHGLVTTAQARDHGVSASDVAILLRRREWVRVRRGVYADAAAWDALDVWRGQPLLRARAATHTMERSWVLSHDSAAHALGLDLVVGDPSYVHVTRPGVTAAWTRAGVKHHYAAYRRHQVVEIGDLRVLEPARTVCDVAREHGLRSGLVAADAALRAGTDRRDLRAAAAAMWCWPGRRQVDAAIELADGRAESAAESLARLLVLELGEGTPDVQFPVRTPGGLFWADLRLENHLVEVDGLVKYRGADDGGLAVVSADLVLREEKRRESELTTVGLGMSRLIWADFWGEGRERAKRRLRADLAATRQRYGDVLPQHLAADAARIRALTRGHRGSRPA